MDLTQRPRRSTHARLGGFVILPRMLDKGRATLAKKKPWFDALDLDDYVSFGVKA
jgi:uncharacterized protein DUF5069